MYTRVPNNCTGPFNRAEGGITVEISNRTVQNKSTEWATLSKLIIVQGILIV